ncbi:MAG: DUF1902 domain-containing protein [Lachnospiraceae bacterium]|nr:DUF1902 domain-containing protein [Lachnospiraceae bacterium]
MLRERRKSMRCFMDVAVRIHWDDEAEVWVAINDELGIALESESYDALVERLKMAIPEMAELNGLSNIKSIIITTDTRQMTYGR